MLTNKHTGNKYVGQTIKSVARRWYAHCISAKNPKFPISFEIANFGPESFLVEEVFVAFDKEQLNSAEKQFILDIKPSLNRTSGGAGSSRSLSPEECKKRSDAAKARWANPEWRQKTVESIKAAAQTDAFRERGRSLNADKKGSIARWGNHVKKVRTPVDKSELTRLQWKDEKIRQARIEGLKRALANPEAKERHRRASTGRKQSSSVIEKIARAKWKPIYCKELEVTFLCQKYAAEFLGVLGTSVSNAVKSKGKVRNTYTLARVA